MHLTGAELRSYLRGQLSPARASEVERHFAQCDPCASKLSAIPEESEPEPSHEDAVWPERGSRVGHFVVGVRRSDGDGLERYDAKDAAGAKVELRISPKSERGDRRARLLRLATARAKVRDPKLLAVLEAGAVGDRIYVAAEAEHGTRLAKWLQSKRPAKQIVEAFRQGAAAVAVLHAHGLAQAGFDTRDVLLREDGARLTVRGLWRAVDAAAADASVQVHQALAAVSGVLAERLLRGGALAKTLSLSPEQLAGRPADARGDQFAFAAALYEALWKQRPFDPERLVADARRAMEAADPELEDQLTLRVEGVRLVLHPPKGGDVPESVRKAILKALEVEPEERFESMEELLAALDSPFSGWLKRLGRKRAAAAK